MIIFEKGKEIEEIQKVKFLFNCCFDYVIVNLFKLLFGICCYMFFYFEILFNVKVILYVIELIYQVLK